MTARILDGKVIGSPFLSMVQGWHGISGLSRVSADTTFVIQQGRVITSRDAVVRSNEDLLTMAGWVDFDRNMQYSGQVKALNGPLSPEFMPYTAIISKDGFLPFLLAGSVDEPKFQLQLPADLLQRGVKTALDILLEAIYDVLDNLGVVEIVSTDISASLSALTGEVSGLNHIKIRQPNLEDLFLDLTGHSLRA